MKKSPEQKRAENQEANKPVVNSMEEFQKAEKLKTQNSIAKEVIKCVTITFSKHADGTTGINSTGKGFTPVEMLGLLELQKFEILKKIQ